LQWNSLIPGNDYLAVATEVTKTFEKEVELKKILFGRCAEQKRIVS
jgi:hypothetical protein